jgi:glucose-6-phosphate isomerase
MPIVQSIENARAERVADGVGSSELSDALARSRQALDWLRARHADHGLPLLHLPAQRDDIQGITETAERLTNGASDIVLLGTGGSSLGGQTLAQLAGHAVPGLGALRPPPRLHFMDNLDPETFGGLLQALPLASTRFVAISKSGGTGETLMQTIAALTAVKPHPGTLSRPDRAGKVREAQRAARSLRAVSYSDARP